MSTSRENLVKIGLVDSENAGAIIATASPQKGNKNAQTRHIRSIG